MADPDNKTVTLSDIKSNIDTVQRTFGEFKDALAGAQKEVKEHGGQLGLTQEKLAKMETTFAKHDELFEKWQAQKAAQEAKIDNLETLLVKLTRPNGAETKGEAECAPELKRFFSGNKEWSRFVRVGEERMTAEEVKSLATDSGSTGGYLVPLNTYNQIVELNVLSSPIRQVASVQTISTGDALEIPVEGSTAFSCGWTSERGSRTESTAGTFALERIPVHEMYSDPYVTQKMIDDSAFAIEPYVNRKLAQQFAKTENTAFVAGTGVGQPEGIIVNPTCITNSVIVSGTGTFTAALLIDMQHSLEEPYASNATWLTKRSNFGKIRQLVLSSYGDYLWQPGISADKGPTLLGQPYLACNDFTAIASASATNVIMAFGDFKAGYMIVDRIGITMLRDPFTNKPYIEFYATKRVGAQVVLPEAIRLGRKDS